MNFKLYEYRETEDFIFFWGSYLSNFCPAVCNIDMPDGKVYRFKDSESAFMGAKALFFKDDEAFNKILKSNSPGDAKGIGRTVKNFNAKEWDEPSLYWMHVACIEKFLQNEDLKQALLSTGSKYLVEASPYDKIWGIGLGVDDDRILDPDKWLGENRLGHVLMTVRTIIREDNG